MLSLHFQFNWHVVFDDFQQKLFVCQAMLYDIALEREFVGQASVSPVLVGTTRKILPFTKKELCSGHHFLVGQEVQFSVARLRLQKQAEVATLLADLFFSG